MRKLICLMILFAVGYLAQAQDAKNLQIIYVDNYQSATDAGLSEVMVDSLHALIGKVKSAQNSVYMFVTDNDNSSETTNLQTLESMYKDINNHAHIGNPVNEQKDLKEMRDGIFERISKVDPQNIGVNYFISNDVLDLAVNSSSFLIDFFPDELIMSAPSANITVSVYYSSAKNKNVKEKLEKSFSFYNHGEYKSSVKFRAIAL